MKQTQSEALIPNKAHIIFDQNQAYAAYSLPKIQYQQFNPLIMMAAPRQIVQPNTEKEQQPQRAAQLQIIRAASKQEARFKEWSVNYQEDIAKRVVFNQIHVSSNKGYLDKMKSMSKLPPKKKSRRHKTKFKVPRTIKNQEALSSVVCEFINNNKKLINDEVVHIKEYEKSAPFFLETVDFAERIIAEKVQFKEKFGLDEKNLRKNNLLLEEVILKRMQKRQNARMQNKALLQKPLEQQVSEQNALAEQQT